MNIIFFILYIKYCTVYSNMMHFKPFIYLLSIISEWYRMIILIIY